MSKVSEFEAYISRSLSYGKKPVTPQALKDSIFLAAKSFGLTDREIEQSIKRNLK